MNILTRRATPLRAILGPVVILASPASAWSLTASDMSFAFGGKATSAAAAPAVGPIRKAKPKDHAKITQVLESLTTGVLSQHRFVRHYFHGPDTMLRRLRTHLKRLRDDMMFDVLDKGLAVTTAAQSDQYPHLHQRSQRGHDPLCRAAVNRCGQQPGAYRIDLGTGSLTSSPPAGPGGSHQEGWMTTKDFGGPQAIRMILDKMPECPDALQDDGLAAIAHLRDAPVAALARHLFTQAEMDAITDLMMEHFEAGGFVADTAIDHLVANRAPE